MRKTKHVSKKNDCSSKWMPLARLIKRQGVKCLKQSRKILRKVNDLDESVEIIAREIARQARGKW